MYATPTIRLALRVAAKAHNGQVRKTGDIPFIVHPVAVALILAEYTDDEITLAAALLHDVLEDCPDVYSEAQMRKDFGDEVTGTVKAVSNDPSIADWRQRNEAYLKNLKAYDNDKAVMVCAADKINNLTDILESGEALAPNAWENFNGGKDDQLWWYNACYELIAECLPEHPLARQLQDLITKLAAAVK